MATDWTRHFDRIFCVHYAEYRDRLAHIERELDRIGVLSSGAFEWRVNYKNPFEQSLARRLGVPPCSFIGPLFIETKRIIAESMHKGYKRILVVQDDAAFLKDTGLLEEVVEAAPEASNVVQFDKRLDGIRRRIENWRMLAGSRRFNKHFVRADGYEFWGAACYSLTREGMARLDEVMSRDLINEDACFSQVPNYAVAITNLCVQAEFAACEKRKNGYAAGRDAEELRLLGLRREDYADIHES